MEFPITLKEEETQQFFMNTMGKLEHVPYSVRSGNVLSMFSPFTGEEIVVPLKKNMVDPNYDFPIKDSGFQCRIANGVYIAEEAGNQIPFVMKKVEYPFDYLLSNGVNLLRYWPYQGRDNFGGKTYESEKLLMRCPQPGCYSTLDVEMKPSATMKGKFMCSACCSWFIIKDGVVFVDHVEKRR